MVSQRRRQRIAELWARNIGNGQMLVIGPYTDTKVNHSVVVTVAGWKRYQEDDYVQNCFPELNADEREFFLTGLSPEGWNQATKFEE